MLLALFCGFFVNLIKKSLTTRFGDSACIFPVCTDTGCACYSSYSLIRVFQIVLFIGCIL